MNAAERFFAAARAHDLTAASAELSPDVSMLDPGSDVPITGRENVTAALRAVEAACDQFDHTHLLADAAHGGGHELYGLVFTARIGEHILSGVDLLTLDDNDRIATFHVAVRPISALMALGARMSSEGPRPDTVPVDGPTGLRH